MNEPPVLRFEVYETIGTTPAHVSPVVMTDDPEFMKALGEAIEAGRVAMDGDIIVSINGISVSPPPEEVRHE